MRRFRVAVGGDLRHLLGQSRLGVAMGARDLGLLVILSVLWGGSFFFVELALPGLPPLTIVFARVAGAALCLALWLWARGIERPRGVAAWRALAVRGF